MNEITTYVNDAATNMISRFNKQISDAVAAIENSRNLNEFSQNYSWAQGILSCFTEMYSALGYGFGYCALLDMTPKAKEAYRNAYAAVEAAAQKKAC